MPKIKLIRQFLSLILLIEDFVVWSTAFLILTLVQECCSFHNVNLSKFKTSVGDSREILALSQVARLDFELFSNCHEFLNISYERTAGWTDKWNDSKTCRKLKYKLTCDVCYCQW